MNPTNQKQRWVSKNGVTVAKSNEHEEMYIVSQADGKFHTIRSTEKIMLGLYPEVVK